MPPWQKSSKLYLKDWEREADGIFHGENVSRIGRIGNSKSEAGFKAGVELVARPNNPTMDLPTLRGKASVT